MPASEKPTVKPKAKRDNLWLKDYLVYDAERGTVYTRETKKRIVADEDGMCWVYDSQNSRNKKFKMNKICIYLATGRMPTDEHRVLHRNLDTNDYRFRNLKLINKVVFIKIGEARKNLEGNIKLQQHPTDQFNYIVSWRENNKSRYRTFSDITAAQRFLLAIKLHFSKILTKYCLFE